MWIEIQRINILTTADCKINERQFPINVFKIKQNPRKKNEWINEKHRRRKQC